MISRLERTLQEAEGPMTHGMNPQAAKLLQRLLFFEKLQRKKKERKKENLSIDKIQQITNIVSQGRVSQITWLRPGFSKAIAETVRGNPKGSKWKTLC
jgi:ribosomal protein L11